MRAVLRRGAVLGASVVAVATSGGVNAQLAVSTEGTGGRGLSVVPSIAISETLTDNSRLTSADRQTDLITQVTPGIRITSTGGRVKGFVDYSLTGLVYARSSSSNELQNSLNSVVKVEAIDNWAFVDATANISQQSISAYGTRSADSTLVNGNRTEVRSLTLSPYVKGKLAGFADYEARLTQNWTRNSSSDTANNSSSLATLRVGGDSGLRVVSWSIDASHQVYDYSAGRRTEDDVVRGLLFFAVSPELRLTLIEGRESNNIASVDKQGHSTPGFGVDWSPTETTKLSGQYERRFFGSSHTLSFEHRTPRTVWRYSDTQDTSTGFGQPVLGSVGTAFDLFFAQFASLQPDPVLRAALVNAFLLANGIAPTTQLFTGSLANTVTRQRRQALSFALIGVRDTVTFGASQMQGLALDNTAPVTGDFANGNLVRARGLSIGVAHRLTPSAGLNLLASIDRTTGTVNAPTTSLRSVSLHWTDQLSSRSNFSLGAHHTKFSSPTDPFAETGLTATLGLRF